MRVSEGRGYESAGRKWTMPKPQPGLYSPRRPLWHYVAAWAALSGMWVALVLIYLWETGAL
jgi:type VI protein secretion system component VasF